ncbi:MAG: hypothetical protein GPJ54_04865 [Candidatus Heimdallarchaeota archaeon]|nr:hypothetical protein [Candidatus Heimdallarchaeota archaeon]
MAIGRIGIPQPKSGYRNIKIENLIFFLILYAILIVLLDKVTSWILAAILSIIIIVLLVELFNYFKTKTPSEYYK